MTVCLLAVSQSGLRPQPNEESMKRGRKETDRFENEDRSGSFTFFLLSRDSCFPDPSAKAIA